MLELVSMKSAGIIGCSAADLLSPLLALRSIKNPMDRFRLEICQGDGKMQDVLDNGHFVRLRFGIDAGFLAILHLEKTHTMLSA